MSRTGAAARAIVDDVLGRGMTREIWTGNYEKALPVSVHDFDLTAVLPAVFYMFRFAHRRGKGKFLETFGGNSGTARERRRAATIDRVAGILSQTTGFDGFDGETERAILGDLLLCFCLENARRALGRKEQIQRVAPAHYMASWIDLPENVANLRYVPETIVAMLADENGDYVTQTPQEKKIWFPVGRSMEENLLLRAFHHGVRREGGLANRKGDRFDEAAEVGLDQLLMIRLAQKLGEAPDKLRGKSSGGDKISNQRPIAELAAHHFSEDIRHFVRAYASVIPRHAFVEMLESCMAVGLTTIVTSVINLLFEWAETGQIRTRCEQRPGELFVDCSHGVNRLLRSVAEQSMDDFMRRIERFPVVLMALRLLDHGVRYDRKLRKLKAGVRPYAAEWLNLLGDVLFERREEARAVLDDLDRKAFQLADALDEEYPESARILRNDRAFPNPVWRVAEALTSLQRHIFVVPFLDSVLHTVYPNGIASKRRATRTMADGQRRRCEVRSIVFSDAVLDYLVHLHVLPTGRKSGYRPLSFKDFLETLHQRYGFCVDRAPPGITASNDLLQENRAVLERRLRDLGLLVGVNDAEAMKHLKPRFEPSDGDQP